MSARKRSASADSEAVPEVAAPKRKTRREGSVTQLAPNRWRVRLFMRRMDDGRRVEFDEVVTGPRAAAIAKLDEFRRRKSAPDFDTQSLGLTLDAWIDEFFRQWANDLRPRTRESYEQVLRLYVADTLRAVTLAKLSRRAIQGWLVDLEQRPSRTGGTLSRRTVAYCRAALRLVLARAVTEGIITANPVEGTRLSAESVRRERARRAGHEVSADEATTPKHPLSEAEVSRFLAAAAARTARLDGETFSGRRDRLAPYWRLAIETGARPSELLGLRWRDVTLDQVAGAAHGPQVRIVHSLTSANGDGQLDEPKTERSRRTVPISAECVRLLRQQRARQAADRLSQKGNYRELDYVFATQVGTPTDIDNLRNQAFKPLCIASGLVDACGKANRRLYDLRHTAATLMLRAGVPIAVVSERLGHTTAAFTLTVYVSVLHGEQDDATVKMAALLDGVTASREDHTHAAREARDAFRRTWARHAERLRAAIPATSPAPARLHVV